MSGDVTYQALERLSHMPDNPSNPADAIAGQKYYDVAFTGGTIDGVTISDSIITNSVITGSTIPGSSISGDIKLGNQNVIISSALAASFPAYTWPMIWLTCADASVHTGGTGNPFCSITLENTSTTNKFGEIAFQKRLAGVPTDTWAFAVDPARTNVENFKLRHTGQDILEFSADNSQVRSYTNIVLDGSIGKILQSYNAAGSAVANIARLATVNSTPDYLVLGMSSSNLAGVDIQAGAAGEAVRIPGSTGEAWFVNRVGIGTGASSGNTAKLTVYGANAEGTTGQTIRLGINSGVDYSIRRNNGNGDMELQGTQAGAMGYKWLNTTTQIMYLSEAGALTVANGATVTTGNLTVSAGNLALGANNIVMTGALGTTGSRLSNGYFNNLVVTSAISGSVTGNAGTVTTNANLTGLVTSVGNATSLVLGQLTTSLASDVNLNNTGTYFDGPTIAQGSTGTWFVSGTVTVKDTASGSPDYVAKLWDGTTTIATCILTGHPTATKDSIISLSGFISSPAGNLRISVKDPSTTTGKIVANDSGTGKDSTISAFRIA